MILTMIGFGEAAQAMAFGFNEMDSPPDLRAFDVRLVDPVAAPALREIAAATGVALHARAQEALNGADIVLALVPGSAARSVAEEIAPHLADNQIYIDLSSTSPGLKMEIGEAIGAGRGHCVEGSIMDAVTPHRHRVPILLAGAEAQRCSELMNGIGMVTEAVGPLLGQASTVKMIRSVMVKGVEALILEAMTAAQIAGVTDRILDSVNVTFDGLDWHKMTSHYLRRTHEHGLRRVSEMKQSAGTLRELGIEPLMSDAIGQTIARGHAALEAVAYDSVESSDQLLPILAAAASRPAEAN